MKQKNQTKNSRKRSRKQLKQQLEENITRSIVPNPIEEYLEARMLKRHFIIHVGETNTGKTYQSLQRLQTAQHGIYLSPLRLLALEVQERFLEQGVMCSMATGEEEDIISNATVMSCTVEKVNIKEEFDIAVIDECQMLRDEDRGWAWTRAILGLICPEIHLCMAPEALDIILQMIKSCGDEYEIHQHTRNTQLIFQRPVFELNKSVRKGDALIVFSRRQVISLAAKLEDMGYKTSVIYGSLPYRSRKEQVRLFLDGETDVVVATDAIGMGMNLPIHRIVFMDYKKYDGKTERELLEYEVKQIAGRAGRQGIYEEGYVAAADNGTYLKTMLNQPHSEINTLQLGIPEHIIDLDYPLDKIMDTWQSIPTYQPIFVRKDMSREVSLYYAIKGCCTTNKEYYDCITIPFDENIDALYNYWKYLVDMHFVRNKQIPFPDPDYSRNRLESLEIHYKMLDLYYQFCKRFGIRINLDHLTDKKEEIADTICEVLKKKPKKVCKVCGKIMPWNTKYRECNACYKALRGESKYYIHYS